MRILHIRFKNLNSLVGEWQIDLTDPAYVSNGIFAITGPTGAGKSTLLDAICLGLYGRTPRLESVSKGGNEIMSRQTGECFAEVTFETQKGRFCAHWSQHRARKRPDGELQMAKHEITDAHTGAILESKIRQVAECIEEVAGMDFERFTRSMLLAQGGFAAFLQAVPDERAPILEQITGTGIYSEISTKVHQRRGEEREKLLALEAELAGMKALSQDEEGALKAEVAQKTETSAVLSGRITEQQRAITWLEDIARLVTTLVENDRQHAAWQVRSDAFAPDLERLEMARRALEFAGEYVALTTSRNVQAMDRNALAECQQILPACEEKARQAEDAVKGAMAHLEQARMTQQQAMLVIRQVRELDVKMAEKDGPITAVTTMLADLDKAHAVLAVRQAEDCAALVAAGTNQRALKERLDETRADEALVAQLAGIVGRFDVIRTNEQQLAAKQQEIGQAQIQLAEASRHDQALAMAVERAVQARDGCQDALAEKHAELAQRLNGQELKNWRDDLAALNDQKHKIVSARDTIQLIVRARQGQDQLTAQLSALGAEEATLTLQREVQAGHQKLLENDEQHLQTQFVLLQRIQSFEEARHQLVDGEPCPVCGANEHPYAQGNMPVPQETEQRLAQVRRDLKALNEEISRSNVRLAEVAKDIVRLGQDQHEQEEVLASANATLGPLCVSLGVDPADPELVAILERLLSDNVIAVERADGVVKDAEAIERALGALRDALDRAKDTLAEMERAAVSAAHAREAAAQKLQRVTAEAQTLVVSRDAVIAALQAELGVYGIATATVERLDALQRELEARRDQWTARREAMTACEQTISTLEVKTQQRSEELIKSEFERARMREQMAGLLRERDALRGQRHALFGDRLPEVEEEQLASTITAAEKSLEIVRDELGQAKQMLDQQRMRMEQLTRSIDARDVELATLQGDFDARLERAGFADEQAYVVACLPESERNALEQRARQLADEQTALNTTDRNTRTQLETERAKALTDVPLDEASADLAQLTADHLQLQQEIGRIHGQLVDNETLKQSQKQRLSAIDAQKRETDRWDRLHELIGSNDGKKYRNFVQGLTFEMMVTHANRQLQKLTDRYLLIRDDKRPLELNVVDNYQAGEIRSTKNLSGGESFIVSLSLALGLSHMASKNVRVDSLFLDEGFGTLDEEALNTALETLAGLQQDGKLIGVISHVPALKERISTQIQVTPKTGGRSQISGPGCGRIGSA